MPYTTRKKIRQQVERSANMIDRSVEHLAKIDALADGKSERITEDLPKLVLMLDGVKQILLKWRDSL